jgi:hypothetical protein
VGGSVTGLEILVECGLRREIDKLVLANLNVHWFRFGRQFDAVNLSPAGAERTAEFDNPPYPVHAVTDTHAVAEIPTMLAFLTLLRRHW